MGNAAERSKEGMNIGLYDPYLDALEGGEKYMLTAASCLSKRHSVSILWDDNTILERGEKKYEIDLKRVHIEKNLFSSSVSFFSRMQLTKKFDAIFYLSDGSIPVVSSKLFLHFQFPVEWVYYSVKTKVKMKKVAGIICNSQFTKKYIDKKFHVKSTIIYPPVLFEVNKDIKRDKENIILSVGRYNRMQNGEQFKKHNRMINTFKKMIDGGLKNWKLVLVISFQEKDIDAHDLEEMAHGYPIRIERNIPRAKITDLYERSIIYWHAAGFGEDIHHHPELAEHFGISTVEAMSYGCVPIVFDAGGQTEIITDGVNGLLWHTEDELIEKTKSVMASNGKRLSLSHEARNRAEDFTIEKFGQSLDAIFS